MAGELDDLDPQVEGLLKEWQCEEMIEQIRGQGFSMAVLKALTPEISRRYFNSDGQWILFNAKLENWKKGDQPQADSNEDEEENNEQEDHIISCVIIVKEYLNSDKEGSIIMNRLSTDRDDDFKLDNDLRNIIADTIILNELRPNYESATINAKRFCLLTKAIMRIFTKEKQVEWFIPPRKVLDTSVAAKGKFYDRYLYQLSRLRKQKVRTSQRQSVVTPITVENDDVAKAKAWLKEGNIDDWNEVKENWKLTSSSRLEALQKGADEPAPAGGKKRKTAIVRPRLCTEMSYFQDYKVILSHPAVLELVQIDFERNYPEADDFFKKNWTLLREFINEKSYLSENITDLEILINFGRLFDVAILNGTFDSTTKKKAQWRASRIEVQQGFLLRVKNRDDLMLKIKAMKTKLKKVKKDLQPIACAIVPLSNNELDSEGEKENLDDETQLDQIEEVQPDPEFFVLLNGRELKTDNALEAVKMNLKICSAFHLNYPYQSSVLWTTFQRLAFGIQTEWDVTSKTAELLIEEFQDYKKNLENAELRI